MERFTLRHLEYLVTCIDQKSIAAAAKILNVSQPTVSVAINKLEDQFGVQLLIRHHSQGVSATTSAEKLLPSARALLAHASDLHRQAVLAGNEVAGDLRFGSFTTLSPVVLPKLIAALANEYPHVNLNIQEAPQETLIDQLREGKLDIALLYDIDLSEEFRLTTLGEPGPYIALPSQHKCSKLDKVSLFDLVDEPMILLDVSPSRDYFLSIFSSLGLKPNIAYSSPSLELVRGMIGQGLGFSILVTRPMGDLTYDGQEIIVKPIKENVAASRIVLASLANLRPTRLHTSLEQIAVKYFCQKSG